MFCSLLVFITLTAQVLCEDVEITTPLGIIRGTEQLTYTEKSTYYSFKGIKYGIAERFERAYAVKPWNGTYDAREEKPNCIQQEISVPQSEDCLYLSVNIPKLPKDNNFMQLPVVLGIHGGFFMFGISRYNANGPDFFMDSANVVFVTFNYRDGGFGFLSSGDGRLSGNQGIKDAILALQWVQDNIAAFGGDPNRVTITSKIIGSSLTSYIIQSPLAKGKNLFHRVILESGSSLCSWSFQRNPLSIFWKTAIAAGCIYDPTDLNFDLAIRCLKNVTADDLKLAILKISGTNEKLLDAFNGYAYAPSIEQECLDAAVTKNTHELLTSNNAPTIPVMTGITNNEAEFLTKSPHLLQTFFYHMDLDNTKLVPDNMHATAPNKLLFVAPAIREYYFHGLKPSTANISDKIRFLSDHHENRPWREYINVLKNKTDVRCYLISDDGINNNLVNGKRMFRLWTNFAAHGNPTPNEIDPVLGDIQWPLVQPDDKTINCLRIGDTLQLIENPKEEQYQFWRKKYDEYGMVRDTY